MRRREAIFTAAGYLLASPVLTQAVQARLSRKMDWPYKPSDAAMLDIIMAPAGLGKTVLVLTPLELSQPISFAWSGPLAGAAGALASRLGYAAWTTMSSGLPLPDPPPIVPVSVGFAAASPAEIVEALNRAVINWAVVVLDPAKRFIGVVYYG